MLELALSAAATVPLHTAPPKTAAITRQANRAEIVYLVKSSWHSYIIIGVALEQPLAS